VRGLIGEAARIQGVAGVFAYLYGIREALAGGNLPSEAEKACAETRDALLAQMAVFEEHMVDWVVPASLQSLSVLYEFLEQLGKDLKAVSSGKKAAEDVPWTLT